MEKNEAVDHDLIRQMNTAKAMEKAPLAQLHELIKYRHEAAKLDHVEVVKRVNRDIRTLLGL